ncbi:hypothetical protein [Streptomyces virginiae]|uniref:hypothetical protein n=1 Tax=Streptomyces virginiae TaxID=1961 RepID=UPI003F5160E9
MFGRANRLLGSNWTLHDLRKTVAYRMARDPLLAVTDVQWALGHAHLSTTQTYLPPGRDEIVDAVRAHHERQNREAQVQAVPAAGCRIPDTGRSLWTSRSAGPGERAGAGRYRCRGGGPVRAAAGPAGVWRVAGAGPCPLPRPGGRPPVAALGGAGRAGARRAGAAPAARGEGAYAPASQVGGPRDSGLAVGLSRRQLAGAVGGLPGRRLPSAVAAGGRGVGEHGGGRWGGGGTNIH